MAAEYELHRLAKLNGIDEHASTENKKALLVALDVLPKRNLSEEDFDNLVRSQLDKTLDAQYEQPLKPVTITRENRQHDIEIVVPAGCENESIEWSIGQENGQKDAGQIKVSETQPVYDDEGKPAVREINGQTFERRTFKMPIEPEFGYHNLAVKVPGSTEAKASLIHAPQKCYDPIDIPNGGKTWGVPVQLYEQKSEENQGMGDFSDLDELAHVLGNNGAGIIGVNPLHAMFPDKPEEASPYAPSSRTYFNHLYLDVTAIPDFENSEQAQNLYDKPEYTNKRRKVQANPLVDYTSVVELKQPIMDACFKSFKKNELSNPESKRAKEFNKYREESGERMHDFALFQALSEKMQLNDPKPQNWKDWPEEYQDIKNPAVKKFEKDNSDRVEFYEYMQWETDRQMAHVQKTAQKAGMKVGLYTDIAVGGSPDGYEGWGAKDLYMKAAAGAPADILSPNGQNWEILGFKPSSLQKSGYKPFIDMMRNNMKHAGCTRLDHVLQLQRLYMIPEGKTAKEGAFVNYPIDDLMAVVALESHRNKAMTIGEDLGQLPPGFREKMADHGILSYRVLPFEREWGYQNGGGNNAMRHPEEYPQYSTAAPSTHDTPPLGSQWTARHVHANDFLGYYDEEAQKNMEFEQYATEREALNWALTEKGCWDKVGAKPVNDPRSETQTVPDKFEQAVADFLGQSNSAVMLMPFSDIFRTNYMGNIPGTRQIDASESPNADKDLESPGASELPYYNWRPKMHYEVHEVNTSDTFKEVADILNDYRKDGNAKGVNREKINDYRRPGRNSDKRRDPTRIHRLYQSLAQKGAFKKHAYDIVAGKFSPKHREEHKKRYDDLKKRHAEKRAKIEAWKKREADKKKQQPQKQAVDNKRIADMKQRS